MKVQAFYIFALSALVVVPVSQAQTLYSNGPSFGAGVTGNGMAGDAWNISNGFAVSDSFSLSMPGTANAFDFTTWNFPGDDTLNSVMWALGTSAFGSDVDSGTTGTLTPTLVAGPNSLGFDVDSYNVSGLADPLAAGQTYWLTLSGATVTSGDSVYWDENDGPSAAFQSSGGAGSSLAVPGTGYNNTCANSAATCTGSETFDITGSNTPEPGTLGLIGCGLLAMAGLIRRKIR